MSRPWQDPEVQRARALIDLGRFADARKLLAPVVAGDPENPLPQLYLAQCHLALGDTQDCITQVQRVLPLCADWDWPYRLLSTDAAGDGCRGRRDPRPCDDVHRLGRQAAWLGVDRMTGRDRATS